MKCAHPDCKTIVRDPADFPEHVDLSYADPDGQRIRKVYCTYRCYRVDTIRVSLTPKRPVRLGITR